MICLRDMQLTFFISLFFLCVFQILYNQHTLFYNKKELCDSEVTKLYI